MSEESISATLEAESHSEETRSFIKRVRRITRRKFTPEEKIRIVLEGFRHEVPIRDLCRREGIRPNVYYAWLRDLPQPLVRKSNLLSSRSALFTTSVEWYTRMM